MKITVVNDAVAALVSGTAGRLYGCVLIAGTGTVALGFDEDKNFKRASGGGPRLGDKGRLPLDSVLLLLSQKLQNELCLAKMMCVLISFLSNCDSSVPWNLQWCTLHSIDFCHKPLPTFCVVISVQ